MLVSKIKNFHQSESSIKMRIFIFIMSHINYKFINKHNLLITYNYKCGFNENYIMEC